MTWLAEAIPNIFLRHDCRSLTHVFHGGKQTREHKTYFSAIFTYTSSTIIDISSFPTMSFPKFMPKALSACMQKRKECVVKKR
jgi:hypothetical protein